MFALKLRFKAHIHTRTRNDSDGGILVAGVGVCIRVFLHKILVSLFFIRFFAVILLPSVHHIVYWLFFMCRWISIHEEMRTLICLPLLFSFQTTV